MKSMEKDKPKSSGFAESQDEFSGKDQEAWPNSFQTREELDSMLEAGLASGVSSRTGQEIIADVLARTKGD